MPNADASAMNLLINERRTRGYWYPPDELASDSGEKRRKKSRRSLRHRHPRPSRDDDAYDAEASDEDDAMSQGSAVHSTVRVSH